MDLSMHDQVIDDKTVIIKLSGEMDIYTSSKLKEKTAAFLKEGHCRLILEMSDLKYIDSTGIGTLVAALTRATEKGGGVWLVAPNRPIVRLLEIVGIDKILKSFPNSKAALEAASNLAT